MEASDSVFPRSWTPIGETSNQLIVYHPPSHAIQVVPHPRRTNSTAPRSSSTVPLSTEDNASDEASPRADNCALCGRPWSPRLSAVDGVSFQSTGGADVETPVEGHYFRVLERAHESSSRPGTPPPPFGGGLSRSGSAASYTTERDSEGSAMGYYRRFFKEERRLGIGAEGSVYLATHVIGGNELGTYAVKKIAVGTSKDYLVRILREVRLLETLRHPNIIPYYHSWVDETRFSAFGPPILALHVLMMYATAGNLDAFLLSRSHASPSQAPLSARDVGDAEEIDLLPKAERIKAFKRRRQAGHHLHQGERRGVLLLGLDEILKLFRDVVAGLAFLHSNSILHLDLKCSNVLLHWEEGQVTPKALLSDFGTSEEMLRGRRERTGHTGTMEYMAPETIVTDVNGNWRPSDSHADMWSLGMVLHKLLFLRLPYEFTEDLGALHGEILAYPGFVATPAIIETCERRHISPNVLLLLEKLLHLSPEQRPSAGRVLQAIEALQGGTHAPQGSGVRKSKGNINSTTQRFGGRQKTQTTSPVRAILALPPSDEITRTSKAAVGSGPALFFARRFKVAEAVSSAAFVLKVMSIQPDLGGVHLPVPMALFLVLLALCDLLWWRPSKLGTIATLVVHFGVLASWKFRTE